MVKCIFVALLLLAVSNAWAIPLSPKQEAFSPDMDYLDQRIPAEIRSSLLQRGLFDVSRAALQAYGESLRDQIAKNPDDPNLLHALGTVMFQLQGEREAIALWTLANNKDSNLAPPDFMLEIQRFYALEKHGDSAAAGEKLVDIERRFATNPHFLLLRAEQAMRGRNFEAAGTAFASAHTIAPELYVTLLNYGRYLAFMGDKDRALPLFQKAVVLAPKRADVWLNLGMLYAALKRDTEALDAFTNLERIVVDSPRAEARLAEFRLGEQNYADAAKWYREALSKKVSPPEAARIHGVLGDVLLRLGKIDEAREQIVASLAYHEQPALVFALATIEDESGESSQAEKDYRRVLELTPENPLAMNNLAMLFVRENRLLQDALHLAERARQVIPGNVIIESTYGCALFRSGRYKDAVEVLTPVLKGNGADPWARYCMGCSQYRIGRKGEAKDILKQLLDDNPNFLLRSEIKKML